MLKSFRFTFLMKKNLICDFKNFFYYFFYIFFLCNFARATESIDNRDMG